jgi:N-acetylglucosamine kinase-like BadF-type ATPase
VNLFAGIDGGQSSTVAVVGDERGRILGRGSAGPADEIGANHESTRLRDALHGALAAACADAGLTSGSLFEAIVAGVSGYDGRVYGRMPALPSQRAVLLHDTPIAHAGALAGRPGVIIIAGTGSVVFGRDDEGRSWTLGGWGFLFGDEGSAFSIVRRALSAMMRAQDDGDARLAAETQAVCNFFAMPSLRRLVHAFYKNEIARDRLAAFAAEVMRFDAFRSLADGGAERLAMLARGAVAAGAPARIAFVGGVFADERFRQTVREAILRGLPHAEIIEPRYEPVYGALLLAYRERGHDVTELRR